MLSEDQYFMLAILVVAIANGFTRAFPFLLEKQSGQMQRVLSVLGRSLPPAMMAMLLVYGLRDVRFLDGHYGIPEITSLMLLVLVHRFLKKPLLGILASTVLYMLWMNVVFG